MLSLAGFLLSISPSLGDSATHTQGGPPPPRVNLSGNIFPDPPRDVSMVVLSALVPPFHFYFKATKRSLKSVSHSKITLSSKNSHGPFHSLRGIRSFVVCLHPNAQLCLLAPPTPSSEATVSVPAGPPPHQHPQNLSRDAGFSHLCHFPSNHPLAGHCSPEHLVSLSPPAPLP